ncbi:MAG: glutamine-synthetase adenylyltransferase [Qingshengfaniella sp.]
MNLISGINRAPLPFDDRAAADALADLPRFAPEFTELLAGTAGCSPYLAGLIRRHGVWLAEIADQDPERVLADLLAGLDGPLSDPASALRQAKAKVALLTGLCDLGGIWSLGQVTGALTHLADRGVEAAFRAALAGPLARGKLPGLGVDDLVDCGGLLALAMGKMGAYELNYSSDIDLICLFDDTRFDDADVPEIRAQMIRVVRKAMGLLSDITAEGYVFRTDLRLRPNPSVTPVVVSISAAERYYEELGRTWERAAFIKARPCAGALESGRRFLKEIRPFIWRRHLDYATIEDAHEIRRKIRAKSAGLVGIDGADVKLGRGGIREIEFFTQTRQLIAGGRDRDLRLRGTCEALHRLVEKGWVPSEDAAALERDYVRLREIEHRLQMVQDAQTQRLPANEEGWQRLAMFCGESDPQVLRDELSVLFGRVHELTEDFFAPGRETGPGDEPADEQMREIMAGWAGYPALRSTRAQQIFARIRPRLLEGFSRAADPKWALSQFDGFIKGLPAGVQVFSLFEANPHLIDLMVDIASTAPALARYLSLNSGVLDAVIGGDFFAPWPGRAALTEELARVLAEPELDYEGQLDTARRWMKDWHFRIGVHHLRGLVTCREAAGHYTDLAEAVLCGVWGAVTANFAARYGACPGRGAVVVGMGSLGAGELTSGSDLDLIIIYDAPADAESDGRRKLAARTYYARLTKALVTALSVQTSAGTLYEVDMRLRPSGRQGPAATGWTAFQTYQREEAWTWEHLALTRARVICGNPALAEDVEGFRTALLAEPRDQAKVLGDLADMRARLSEAKPQSGDWDSSNGPGGGQDIALIAQASALLAGTAERWVPAQLAASGILTADEVAALDAGYRSFARLKLCARLLAEGGFDPEPLGQGAHALILRDSGVETLMELNANLSLARAGAAEIIDRLMPSPGAPEAD